MRVLIDAVHAADVWTLGAVEDRMVAGGARTLWLSREGKEAVTDLIEARRGEHVVASTAGRSRASLPRELAHRDRVAWRTARRFRPDVILTRSPAGVHAGRLTGTPVLYDTDDGHVAGMLYWLAGPLAHVIATPAATTRSYGRRHRRYRGYKELTYLHPRRFTPDAEVRAELGLAAGERLLVLRLTAFRASHDAREAGLARADIDHVLGALEHVGKVVISSEGELPADLADRGLAIRPERFHHVLAAADLVVGDSQTVCSESAVLGIPNLRFNSWAGRHAYQVELEQRWGLTRAFSLDQRALWYAELDRVLGDLDGMATLHAERRRAMLDWCDDPVDDLARWATELAQRRRRSGARSVSRLRAWWRGASGTPPSRHG